MNRDKLKTMLLSNNEQSIFTAIEMNKGLKYFDLKTFEDLDFGKRSNSIGGVQAKTRINGLPLSVVGGGCGTYGDGVNDFEVWFMDQEDDPFGYQTKSQITINMVRACLGAELINF